MRARGTPASLGSCASWAIGLCCAAVLVASSPGAARAEVVVGPHLGINFDWDEVLIGGEARVDIATLAPTVVLQIDPSLTLAFIGGGVAMDFSFNLPFQFMIRDSVVRPYSGPGLALVHYSGDAGSATDLYLNLLAGLLFDLGSVDPFVQLKVMVPHGSMAELLAGALFRID
jgi:hypothetical protein